MAGMQEDMMEDNRSLLQVDMVLAKDKLEVHASRYQHCFCVSWKEDHL